MMDLVNFFSVVPSSMVKMAVTEALFATGRPIEAPWIRSASLFTLRDAVFSPMTNEMASMKLDFPDPLGPITAVKESRGPRLQWPLYDLKLSSSIYLRCTDMMTNNTVYNSKESAEFLTDTVKPLFTRLESLDRHSVTPSSSLFSFSLCSFLSALPDKFFQIRQI
jgi:hypothetical protein